MIGVCRLNRLCSVWGRAALHDVLAATDYEVWAQYGVLGILEDVGGCGRVQVPGLGLVLLRSDNC